MRAPELWLLVLESNGRGAGIRTPDPLLPKQVLYQAELRPDCFRNAKRCGGIYLPLPALKVKRQECPGGQFMQKFSHVLRAEAIRRVAAPAKWCLEGLIRRSKPGVVDDVAGCNTKPFSFTSGDFEDPGDGSI